ncbi:hypothetical protein QJS04_geneDACA008207 [Acorus gramineus]|uniref:DJ-1/PfpI domain-containing protein n=1 Tax=Acorus gramineus TaxID=55184 RepID=A0AAV9B0G4_ACOGR|nr:hypothetical protein QJS04_geneDACA008207 [Acorus gramineus]
MASDAPRKVLVPIADGTEPMEAVITIDVLRRSGADVTVASVASGLQVDASWGLRLVADVLVSDCVGSAFDLVSLSAGVPGSANLRDCEALEGLVRKIVSEGGIYAGICAAPAMILGSWGLLKGLQATCHPSQIEKMPADTTVVESRVARDGRCVTSRGPGTTMEFALELVEQLYGKEKAEEVAGPMLVSTFPLHEDGQGIAKYEVFKVVAVVREVMYSYPANLTVKELNSVSWTSNKTPQILVPIANGSEEMEATMIIDILHRAKAKVVVASVGEKLEIVASRKVKIVADMLLEEAAKLEYDLIVLPGGIGGAQEFASSERLINLLKKQAESGKPYGAICASPALVLEPHGLLKGKKATAYPAMCSKLSDQSEAENRVVIDGNLITSRGPGTSIEFALAIVEKFFGREKAMDLAKTLIFI